MSTKTDQPDRKLLHIFKLSERSGIVREVSHSSGKAQRHPCRKRSHPLVGPNPLKPSSSSLECLFLLRAIPGIIPASSGQRDRLLGRGDKKRHGLSPCCLPEISPPFILLPTRRLPF
ncbi:hypothetical protein CEXT_52441 [Caerostris extrusa]|uniref:Uncharacterized protein n=1 Tax=Caerostris extrusa TaxID=172846 RepID=A0AAV4RUH9_CAEEX|nr:hypothetical protein CEXT_52441 [Caerostris extrusa]